MRDLTIKEKKLTKANQSSIKLLNILENIIDHGQPLRLQEIAKDAGMNPSTTLRFVSTLEQCGYVRQDPQTQKYYTTMKLCALSSKIMSNINNNVRDMGRSILRSLSHVFKESACLSIEKDMAVFYTDVQDGPDQMLRTMQRIGSTAPLHCTGVGKLMLTNYSDAELDNYISVKGLPKLTPNTICTKEELVKELDKIRQRGYAYDNEECEIGARCIAVASRDHTGRVAYCLSVTGPSTRLTDEKINANLTYMLDMAYQLSIVLGYPGSRSDWKSVLNKPV